jgi:signal transduction histidine kinase
VQQASDRQATFVADASHQLRTPLASLMLRLENLGADLPCDRNPELAELCEEVERMHRIVEGLLQLATVDQSRLCIEEVSLAELIEQRVRAAQPRAEALATKITFPVESMSPLAVSTDCTLVGSAFEAVLDNAIKFSPPDGEVRVAVAVDKDHAEVTVSDQGPGLPVQDLQRIGDRFWRSSRHQNVEGTGLGLAVARSMLEAVGGTLAFAANMPSGLTVTLRLPRAATTAPSSTSNGAS